LLALWLVAHACLAQTTQTTASERSVKAAYLYKFAGYVDWPAGQFAGPDAPILIGVAGDPALAQELVRLTADHRVNGRPIAVKLIEPGSDLNGLDILFVSRNSVELERLLSGALAADRPILTVTENDGSIPFGSIINLVIDHERVRFEVSLYAAERSGLKINSRLLSVARRVYGPRTTAE
jgi:hypothetical protein